MDLSLFNTLRQFDLTLAGEAMDVYAIDIREALFEDFSATVTLVSQRRLTIRDYLGEDAVLTLLGRKENRYIHGMVAAMEELEERGRHYLYRIGIMPYLYRLGLIQDVRIFQNTTVPDIIAEVLKTGGILSSQVEFRLHEAYAPREYCVQYRETGLDFIRRLIAEEGMFYYYEFTDSAHLLIMGDSYLCHRPVPGIPRIHFSPKGQLIDADEPVTVFDVKDAVTTGRIDLADYHFEKPSYQPRSRAVSDRCDDLARYDYPGYLADETTGGRLARVLLERHTHTRLTMAGESVCKRFVPGHRFTLTDHPNADTAIEYTLLSVHHQGKQPQALRELAEANEGNTYGNTFTCIPSETTYRPPAMKKPSVFGVQTAVVTGPDTEEIFTDSYGRIKVRFHWDRNTEAPTDKTSCWMRVAQSFAGSGWGALFIPRIGQEVIVSFIDGDPDRPLITGAVYNGRNTPPYALPDEKTKTTIKTESTPGGGGFNELRFDDKKDEEEIYLHGEKDWRIEILNDKSQTVGRDETLDVGNDRSKTVANDQKESIGNNKDITVTKNHTESIGENSTHSIGKNSDERVGEDKTVAVGKKRTERIGDDSTLNVGKNLTLSVSENRTEDIGRNHTETIGKNLTLDVGEKTGISIGKDLSLMVGTKTVISSQDQITFECGQAAIIMKKDGKIQISGVDITISAGGKLVTRGQAISGN
ncbi:type VI secretion system tip protein VgrG [Desulfatiferula olefinivorans]